MATWLEENKKYKEFLENKYLKFYEADRSRFISKNSNLTDEQKSEIIDIFKKYPNADKGIKWGSSDVNNWSYEQFKPYIEKVYKYTTIPKFEDLEEGKDYIVLSNTDKYTIYQPLSYKGSVVLASDNVEPKVSTPLPNWYYHDTPSDDYKNIGSDLWSGAKWCISMHHTSKYWDDYIDKGIKFIFILNKKAKSENTRKIAIAVYPNEYTEIYYSSDSKGKINKSINIENLIPKLQDYPTPDYIEKGLLILNKETNRYDCQDTSKVEIKDLIENGKFKYLLGIWNGNFRCFNCDSLTSLKGAPDTVEGDFVCINCNSLKSLAGAPTTVGGNFCCSLCDNLTSLAGIPTTVEENFYCNNCENLTSLEGAPKTVKGSFDCRGCKKLTSLAGAPTTVGGRFDCSECENLTSLEGVPDTIGGSFDCRGCKKLTSLAGAPTTVGWIFDCSNCNSLKSLAGAPTTVGWIFDCSNCKKLTSLAGAPKTVKGNFCCIKCKNLTSLEGAPDTVEGNFDCNRCENLTSLDGFNTKIGGRFYGDYKLEQLYNQKYNK